MLGAGRVATGAAALALGITALAGGPTASAQQTSAWTPTGPNPDATVQACGTTLTIRDLVNRVESRTVELADGAVRTDYRGKLVSRVSAPDGRKVALDNSGRFSVTELANGDVAYDVRSPALIYYFDDVERAAFNKAGLPAVFYYTSGRTRLYVGDGYENVVQRPKKVTSICTLLRR
jgi:hypothetical protein